MSVSLDGGSLRDHPEVASSGDFYDIRGGGLAGGDLDPDRPGDDRLPDERDDLRRGLRVGGDVRPDRRNPRVVVAYGTRPEKIKLEPVVEELRRLGVEVEEWQSGQHRDLGGDWTNWQDGMAAGVGRTIEDFGDLWRVDEAPDAVIVQGDTATAFACAQAAFLARVPVAHVEAGLRTYAAEPFPEEAFRRQIAAVAKWHFAPDTQAAHNILHEQNAPDMVLYNQVVWGNRNVYVVGNTVIDTMPYAPLRVLATLHRRENWGRRIQASLDALAAFQTAHGDSVDIRVVSHPNWASQGILQPRGLTALSPMNRDRLLTRLRTADLVVTDSGGLQEEAAHFGKPCAVLRSSTERVALERAGAVELLDPDEPQELEGWLRRHLDRRRCYGSGDAAQRIARILVEELDREVEGAAA